MNLIKKYWFILFLLILATVLVLIKVKYANKGIPEELENNGTSINQNISTGTVENNNETRENTNETEEIVVTPSVTETIIRTEAGEEYYADGDLSDNLSDYIDGDTLEIFLPYQGQYFKVNRYLNTEYLEVIIKNENDLPKAKEEVENWLKENDTNSQETPLVYVFE